MKKRKALTVKLPFPIGSFLYVIHRVTSRIVKCPDCAGKGYKGHWEDEWSRDHYSNCRRCGGRNSGYEHGTGEIEQQIDPVWELTKECKEDSVLTSYRVDEFGSSAMITNPNKYIVKTFYTGLENLFTTKAAAIAECRKRNRKMREEDRCD